MTVESPVTESHKALFRMFNDQGYSSSMRLTFFNKIDSILKNYKNKKYFIDLILYDIKYLEDIPMILTFTKYLTDSKQL